jgi:hypothetical protein
VDLQKYLTEGGAVEIVNNSWFVIKKEKIELGFKGADPDRGKMLVGVKD